LILQLRHQAKDLLRQVRRADRAAIAELTQHHPGRIEPGDARLADAQLALARSYGVASWPLAWGQRFHEQEFVSKTLPQPWPQGTFMGSQTSR
jgi:hypothetical protein